MSRSRRASSAPRPPCRRRERAQARVRSGRLDRPSGARAGRRRRVPVHARRPPDHVSRQALDHAPVRGLRDRGSHQCAVPPSARRGSDGVVGGVRSTDPDGVRLRPSHGRGRSGARRRGDRYGGRSGASVRRDSPGPGLYVHDHQRDGRRAARDVRRGRGGAGRAAGQAVLLAMYVVVGEEQGVPRGKLQGTVQNDILKEFIARGTYIYPIEPSLRLAIDVCRFVHAEGMTFNPISISGYHMREAGATAVQEVAFTFANGLEYVRRAVALGLDVNELAPRLSFFFAAFTDLFEEVAKFRAARRLWARLMKENFGAADSACRLRFHTQTGGSTLTAQQPENNVVRVAIQALAAVLGGTQSLHTNAYDEALALPTEQSATLALRTQQILAHETGVPEVVDPAGGSWYVEALTERIEGEARALLEEVEAGGGAARAT